MNEVLGSIEDIGQVRSDVNQVGEEAVARIQEEARQAKQVAQQIKKDKLINQHFSAFLSFLLKSITDEQLVAEIYNTFFKTVNPKNNITYLRKDINTKVLCGFFVPFYLEEAKKMGILPAYKMLHPEQAWGSLKAYVQYLEALASRYHDNVPLHQTSFVNLVILIAQHFLSQKGTEVKDQVLTLLHDGWY